METAEVVNFTLAGVLTGNEICTWAFVHRAAKRLPMEQEVALEKRLTQLMIAPMGLLMTATVGSGVWAASRPGTGAARYIWAGTGCYAAMLGITLVGNMPLNAATLRATERMDRQGWMSIRRRWDQFHGVRNVFNVTGLVLLAVAAARV
jgi:uncharacterized membrane protein